GAGADDVRHGRKDQRGGGETAALDQVGLQPGLEEPDRVHIARAERGDAPELDRAQRPAPRHAAVARRRLLADLLTFGRRYSAHFPRRVAEPEVPDQAPQDAEDSEQVERSAPAVVELDRHDQQRRHRGADLARHPDDSPDAGAPALWNPA